MLINGHSTAHVYRTLKPSLQLSKPLGQAVPWKIAFSFFSTRKNDFFPLAFLLSNTFFGCKMSDHFWHKTDKTTPWLNGIKVTPDVVHCSVGGSEDSNLPGGQTGRLPGFQRICEPGVCHVCSAVGMQWWYQIKTKNQALSPLWVVLVLAAIPLMDWFLKSKMVAMSIADGMQGLHHPAKGHEGQWPAVQATGNKVC